MTESPDKHSVRSLGVVMDPIDSIIFHKDSTLAILLAAQDQDWELFYMEPRDIHLRGSRSYAYMRRLKVRDDPLRWFELAGIEHKALDHLQVILMRKDPPVDIEYIYTTMLLEVAEHRGCLVVNRPRSLRDANEKLFATGFSECIPPTLVSSQARDFRDFLAAHRDIILKPLGNMGGHSVFRIRDGDPNTNVIIETLTELGSRLAMAQKFIPEISAGDKRILLIEGEPVPYALARVPAPGENRGNLAAGGKGHGVPLSPRDRWIASRIGPTLCDMGILFAGIDVIGDYLTEINITSPTCIRELDREYGLNIGGLVMNAISAKLAP